MIAVAVGLVIVLVLALVIAVFGSGSSSGPPKTVGTFNTELQFDIRCGSCHRPGGPGPHLSQAVLTKAFPNIEDQIKFVENGKDGMPAFKGNLTSDQLRQIVEYTRTLP